MDMILFIYNILLIILYTCPMIYAFNLYSIKKYPLYLYLSIMFAFFILDNIIIYMTEFLDKFAHFYDLQFMTIPSFKTIIMISIIICYFLIQEIVLKKGFKLIDYLLVIWVTVYLLLVPIFFKGALMVWFYYLPYQLITIYLSYIGLKYLKKNPNLIKDNKNLHTYRNLLLLTFIFSFLIIIEDSIVISSFDIYSNILVKINNRSITEDILSIIYSVVILKYLSNKILKEVKYGGQESKIESSTYAFNNTPSHNDFEEDTNNSELVFYDFVQFYNLTSRESDILKLILEHKNNQEISTELFISVGTVKTHTHNLFLKIGVSKRNLLLVKYKEYCNQNSNTSLSK